VFVGAEFQRALQVVPFEREARRRSGAERRLAVFIARNAERHQYNPAGKPSGGIGSRHKSEKAELGSRRRGERGGARDCRRRNARRERRRCSDGLASERGLYGRSG
jgi:hypothetical protein